MSLAAVTAQRRIPMTHTTFAVCRRVNERRFFLRPDAALTALFTWLFCVLAPRFGVEVHAATVLSTHYHVVISVADQRISDFFQHFNARLAGALNVLRRAPRGVVWEPGGLSIVELKTADAIVQAIAYAIVNPVAAGLAWSPEDWPGLNVLADEIGRRVLSAARPGYYFDPKKWAERASHPVTLPGCLVLLWGEEETRRKIAEEVELQLTEAREKLRASGREVLGPARARRASPYRRAKSWEPFGKRDPHFATGRGRVAERIEAARELVAFRREYRETWQRYKAGERDLVWPYGTYLMRVRHGARVAEAPP